jgi:PqqD family protein of HPr-rel-A system
MPGVPASDSQESVSASRWQSIAADLYIVAEYNDEFAVYHRPSGKTHFLNAAGIELIANILTSPQTVEAAAIELARRRTQEAPPDTEFVRAVADTIARLRQIGFVYAA